MRDVMRCGGTFEKCAGERGMSYRQMGIENADAAGVRG